MVNFVQWSMIAYPVVFPQSMLTPTVVLGLGSLILKIQLCELVDLLCHERFGGSVSES